MSSSYSYHVYSPIRRILFQDEIRLLIVCYTGARHSHRDSGLNSGPTRSNVDWFWPTVAPLCVSRGVFSTHAFCCGPIHWSTADTIDTAVQLISVCWHTHSYKKGIRLRDDAGLVTPLLDFGELTIGTLGADTGCAKADLIWITDKDRISSRWRFDVVDE